MIDELVIEWLSQYYIYCVYFELFVYTNIKFHLIIPPTV